MDRGKLDELIQQHWEYVKGILIVAGHDSDLIDEIGYHYRTAFYHGYKHCLEETNA